MRAILFANGELPYPEQALAAIRPDDLIIAADGGAKHCLRLNLTPHLVVGDLDSLELHDLQVFEAAGVEIIRYPARKDFTDLELALQIALQRGRNDLLIFGALGARWDQTLANLLLPAANFLKGARVRLVEGRQEIELLRAGQTIQLSGRPGDTVSLVPLGGDATGITTHGLEYPLAGGTLVFGSTRGVSNVLLKETAEVMLAAGILLCVVIHMGEV